MEYYSAIKKNEIMPFAATCMNLEIIILNKSDKERQISYDITKLWNLLTKKRYKSTYLQKPETYLHILKTNLPLLKGKCRGEG